MSGEKFVVCYDQCASVQCKMCSVQCAVCSVRCAVCSVGGQGVTFSLPFVLSLHPHSPFCLSPSLEQTLDV